MMAQVQIGDCILIHGDCLDVLPTQSDGLVDAIISDPPYGVDAAEWDGRVPHELITDFLRIASGPVVWFGSASNAVDDAKSFPVPPDRMMIWSPRFTLSKCAKDGFAYRFHPIWWWRVRTQSAVAWDVLDDPTECGNWWKHNCTKPVGLMDKLVCATTDEGQIVLDAFMGSGTTGVSCVRRGRKFIGIEKDRRHFEVACERIRQAVAEEKMQIFK